MHSRASFVFPVISGERCVYPLESQCPICKKAGIFEPNSFACLIAGAVLMDRSKDSGGPDENLDGFMRLTWHGAHTQHGGRGDYPEIYTSVTIAEDVISGQFELYFCSTACLRKFFNEAVDELETKMLNGLKSQGKHQ